MAPLLDVSDLSVSFLGAAGPVSVLNGADLTVEAGQSVGVVGESGSGKTVLVRAILGLLDGPWRVDGGSVRFQGDELLGKSERELQAIRGKDIALTTPEPRKHLEPLRTIGEQIANVVQAHSELSRKAALDRATALLRAVGIPDPEMRLAGYPHELSGGMCQRVIIAMALAHSSKLLLVDEPTAGLDVTISRQILDLMHDLVRDFGSSVLLVSRDLGVVAHYCQRVAVMYAGQIVEAADVHDFFDRPVHPYSQRLLRAAAAVRDHTRAAGAVSALHPPAETGCAYAPRCPVAVPLCEQEAPALETVTDGHVVRCVRAAELVAGKVAV
jgi:peptide/nickel transport system ATP-binding protein